MAIKKPARLPMTCARCKAKFRVLPAVSRVDDWTAICPACGRWEAFYQFLCHAKGLDLPLPGFDRGCDQSDLDSAYELDWIPDSVDLQH